MKIHAAVLTQPGLDGLTVDVIELDEPLPHEVVVRVVASGLCHSDLHIIDGTLGVAGSRVLGHEMSGVVESVGARVTNVMVGQRVVACLAMSCGECAACLRDQRNLCLRRSEAWARPNAEKPRLRDAGGSPVVAGSGIGGLAERVLVDERAIVAIPDAMPLVPAALLGCAVLTGTGAVIRSAHVPPGATVAVVGCGGVGLSIIQAARISGARSIIAVDRSEQKLTTAAALGATDLVVAQAGSNTHLEQVRDITGGDGVDFAFEAVGSATTVADCLTMLARRGTATVVGVFPAGVDLVVPARDMLTRETRLQGSYMGSSSFRRDVPELCKLYLSGALLLDEMIEPILSLDQVRHGFELMASGAGLRPVVAFEQTR